MMMGQRTAHLSRCLAIPVFRRTPPSAKARLFMLMIVLPDLSEEDRLLAAARTGSPAALTQIYDAYFQPIYRFIRMRVDDPSLAEDLTSDVFVKLIEASRRRKGPATNLRGWLFQVARNLVHDHYRGRKGLTEEALHDGLPGLAGDPEAHAAQAVSAEQVRHALRRLGPEQQEVLILRFAHSLSLQETADIMGKQTNAIKQLQFRATQALRRALAPMMTEPDHG
jgi:RNA polymerase sigma-70 factor (ECF subfamily)